MLENLFYLILCIVIYQYQVWLEALVMVCFSNAMLNTGYNLIPGHSSNWAALCLITLSTLNSPMYQGQSFPSFDCSFRCFMDNSTLSPGLISHSLLTLLSCCLSSSAYYIGHQWTSVHSLHNFDKQSSTTGIYSVHTTISISLHN